MAQWLARLTSHLTVAGLIPTRSSKIVFQRFELGECSFMIHEILILMGWLRGEFQPGLPIKCLKNGARDYMKKVSVLFELPGLKHFNPVDRAQKIWCNRMKKFSLGWKGDRHVRCKLAKQQRLATNSCLGSLSTSVSHRAEIFHVIIGFLNPVCRAEIFPCNQPVRGNNSDQSLYEISE